ncbi:uncharacterized protein LOC111079832 [Drosophila obscura]|uniref:uncharacterized protein LOC111079832 n=1 Tax=Drosophila obscura TaxID=7282 RepID=UPI001BB0F225|nr:uncharacterized protein LOC111079832 [Drosophila obscura]
MSRYKSTLQSEDPDEIGGRPSDAATTTFNMDDWRKIFHEEPSPIGIVPEERVHIEHDLQTFMETLDAADGADTFDDVQELQVLIKTETIDDDGEKAIGSSKMKKKSKKKAAGQLHQKKPAGTLQQKPKVKKRILRRRLEEFSFVQKLYLATNSPSIDFVNWSKRGKHLIVQYMALQEHLTGPRSIFRCRSVLQFAEELSHHGFMRVLDYDLKDPAKGTIVLVFQHPNFVMGMPQKLRQISNLNIQEDQENELLQKQNGKDICAAFHSYLSPLQAARCRLHTELSYHFDMALLQEYANASNKPVAKRAGRPAQIVETTVEQQLVGKTDKFVNPYESVAKILTKQVPSYAGYYGNVALPKLQDFFQEYMPRYGIKISGYKQIVIDGHNKSSDFNQNLPIGIDYSDEENDDPAKKETFDLEQVMQQLCGEDGEGIASNTPNSSSTSSSTFKPKEKPNPKPNKSKQKSKPTSKLTALLESSSTSSSSSSDDDDELDEDSAALEIVLNENNGTYKFIKKTKAQEKLSKVTAEQKGSKKRQNADDQEKGKEPLTKKSKKLQTADELVVMPDDNEETLEETVQKNLKPFLQNGGDEEDGLMDFAGDDDDEEYIDQKVLRRTATLSAAKRRSYDLRKAKLSSKNK